MQRECSGLSDIYPWLHETYVPEAEEDCLKLSNSLDVLTVVRAFSRGGEGLLEAEMSE